MPDDDGHGEADVPFRQFHAFSGQFNADDKTPRFLQGAQGVFRAIGRGMGDPFRNSLGRPDEPASDERDARTAYPYFFCDITLSLYHLVRRTPIARQIRSSVLCYVMQQSASGSQFTDSFTICKKLLALQLSAILN